jgi:hypothetical protein
LFARFDLYDDLVHSLGIPAFAPFDPRRCPATLFFFYPCHSLYPHFPFYSFELSTRSFTHSGPTRTHPFTSAMPRERCYICITQKQLTRGTQEVSYPRCPGKRSRRALIETRRRLREAELVESGDDPDGDFVLAAINDAIADIFTAKGNLPGDIGPEFRPTFPLVTFPLSVMDDEDLLIPIIVPRTPTVGASFPPESERNNRVESPMGLSTSPLQGPYSSSPPALPTESSPPALPVDSLPVSATESTPIRTAIADPIQPAAAIVSPSDIASLAQAIQALNTKLTEFDSLKAQVKNSVMLMRCALVPLLIIILSYVPSNKNPLHPVFERLILAPYLSCCCHFDIIS